MWKNIFLRQRFSLETKILARFVASASSAQRSDVCYQNAIEHVICYNKILPARFENLVIYNDHITFDFIFLSKFDF